ncbi:acyltransferase family protein [Faunimonas sp. B44]|uniref:acyltransferase family protein n=1 Tax=Faunimonas sp. B44 TaxID=3461493 RepID=UPI004043D097
MRGGRNVAAHGGGAENAGRAAVRADIQGLRAVAVLAVILYHFGVPFVPGGFVGVDVFFVISGYLICSSLVREAERTGRIDLLAFWGRRAKRLLPNALLTISAVLVVSAVLLPGFRYERIAEDGLAATFFVANYVFAGNAVDYFRMQDPPSPFLHFWSLSVEEQFYVGLPILLVLGLVRGRARPRSMAAFVLGALLVGSFGYALFVTQQNQPMAYFHTETRVWQLAAGGLAGLYAMSGAMPSPRIGRAMAWAGALGVAFAVAWITDDVRYPGAYALLPTLAAVLLLLGAADRDPLLRRVLCTAPARWIGDRSYSLYLWHWPLIVFAAALWPASGLALAAAAIAVFVVAALAYRFVEAPIHFRPLGTAGLRRVLPGALASIALVGASAFASTRLAVSPHSADREQAILAAARDFGRNYPDRCHLLFEDIDQPACLYGSEDAERRVVLFGDSHAAQWFAPLLAASEAKGWAFHSWTKTACPSADVSIWYPPTRSIYRECDLWRERIFDEIASLRPDMVVIANYSHYDGWLLDRDDGTVARGRPGFDLWRAGLEKAVERLLASGARVVLIRDNPRQYAGFRDCLAGAEPDTCGRPRREAIEGYNVDEEVRAAFPAVTVMDFTDDLCSSAWCPAERDGRILYQDDHHLTASFAETFANRFSELLSVRTVSRGAQTGQGNDP